ncbi:hypothetical protein BGZ76_002002 [Entomortierella beljakovae]|nr:hypothetical protein BGZ76_002002 [Entomortierella beljakovae]
MSIKRAAQTIDVELMSPTGGGFNFEQLVELAGFSVAQAITKEFNKEDYARIVVFSGPGNNGLDGLVAARHLWHFGYQPKIYYPKQQNKPVNLGLLKQCTELNIPFVDSPESGLHDSDLIVDAIFGFSFSGDVRQPFVSAIQALKETKLPIVSGNINGSGFQPTMLVSLTAPKEGSKDFKGPYHYLGGRFISKNMEERWGLNLPGYPGTDQCVKLNPEHEPAKSQSTKKDVGEKMDKHFLGNVVLQSLS